MNKIQIAGALAVSAALASGIAAAPASASGAPVVYTAPAGWGAPRVEPSMIYIGYDRHAVNQLRWSRWNSRFAKATGAYHDNFTGYHVNYRATVTLSEVKFHHGHPYYSYMVISAHGHKTIRIHSYQGGF